MQFQILDVDYIFEDRVIIRIFGKTGDGKTVCCFYEDYKPYFYAEGSGVRDVLKTEPQVTDIQDVERYIIGDEKPRKICKVTIKNPAKTPELRERLEANGIKTYEADVLFKYRFMNDAGLGGLKWVNVAASNGVTTNTVNMEQKIQAKKIKEVERLDDVPLKYMAFDIECVPTRGDVPNEKDDPVILISVAFSEMYKGKKNLLLSTRSDPDVMSFENEKEMLEEFIRVVLDYDPDVITGFNANNFDFPYVLERMRQNSIKPVFGRCATKYVSARKLGPRYKITIPGRIVADSYELVKKDYSLQRYSLDFVAKKLLNKEKVDVKKSEIAKLWNGGQEDFKKLVSYSRRDSVLALDLILKLGLVDKYIALSKVSGTLLQDTLNSGETLRIENYLLKEFNKQGYVLPCKLSTGISRRQEKTRQELGGGEVLEPVKGLHSSIAVLDFRAMYPSIIKTFNICPTTLIKGDYKGECIKTPSGVGFLPRNVKIGIVPRIVENLMETRQKVKEKMARCRNPDERKLLNTNQWALKIMANAFYGYFGYARSRLFNLDIANAITSTGRDIIMKTKKTIESLGYQVVYGDTDSVFVKIPEENLDSIAKTAKDVAVKITNQLPGVIQLDFEKVFKRFLPLTKKRYVAWGFTQTGDGWEEGIEMKGIETVRRDWCDLVGITMRKVLKIILKDNDIRGALEYFKGVVSKLLKNEIPIQSLVVTKTMTKSPGSYAGIQPHIELVKKIQKRSPGEVPGVGDRVGFVIVKGMDMLSKRAEDPVYVMENGLQIDSQYYIENQLLPPLERVFAGLGISKSELLGNGKQIGIFDAIKNHRQQELQKIPFSAVSGFVCKRCSKFYPRVPLVGVCECGGSLAFSSKHGQAEFVIA